MNNKQKIDHIPNCDSTSFVIEEIKGKSNIFKAKTNRNGNIHELMVFALSDDQFEEISKPEKINDKVDVYTNDRMIFELK